MIHRIAAGGDFCYLLAPRNVSNLLLLICKDRIIEDKAEPKKYFLLWITQKTVKTRNISLQKKKGLKDGLFKVESELSLIIQVVYGQSVQIIVNNNNKHVMTGSERNS